MLLEACETIIREESINHNMQLAFRDAAVAIINLVISCDETKVQQIVCSCDSHVTAIVDNVVRLLRNKKLDL